MGRIGEAVEVLAQVVARLRGPGGCPWDRAQTHTSLLPYLLEEAYELAQALQDGVPEKIREELGDLLLQVVLHAQLAAESGQFDLAQVATEIREKLVRRHPHVFGEAQASTPAEVRARWEELKQKEGKRLDLARPALLAARKFLETTDRPFHHPYLRPPPQPPSQPQEEIGRLLLAACALALRWGVEPELALRRTLQKLDDG